MPMWFLILLAFVVIGGIIGALSNKEDGALNGVIGGLYVGGSCLLQLFIAGISIFIVVWLFGLIFG